MAQPTKSQGHDDLQVAISFQQQRIQDQATLLAAQEARIKMLEGSKGERIEYKLHTLESNNYIIWKMHTQNILEAKGLLDIVKDKKVTDLVKEKQARALLTSVLSNDNQMKVINCASAHKIWTKLASIYENKTMNATQELFGQFHGFRIRSVRDVLDSISKIENIAAKLRALGEDVSDKHIISVIYSALPKAFDLFKAVWKGTPENERTLNAFISRVVAEVPELVGRDQPEEKAYVARPNSFKRFKKGRGNRPTKRFKGRSQNVRPQTNDRDVSADNAKPDRGKQGYRGPGNRDNRRATPAGKCFRCNRSGHWSSQCRVKLTESVNGNKDANRKLAYVAKVVTQESESDASRDAPDCLECNETMPSIESFEEEATPLQEAPELESLSFENRFRREAGVELQDVTGDESMSSKSNERVSPSLQEVPKVVCVEAMSALHVARYENNDTQFESRKLSEMSETSGKSVNIVSAPLQEVPESSTSSGEPDEVVVVPTDKIAIDAICCATVTAAEGHGDMTWLSCHGLTNEASRADDSVHGLMVVSRSELSDEAGVHSSPAGATRTSYSCKTKVSVPGVNFQASTGASSAMSCKTIDLFAYGIQNVSALENARTSVSCKTMDLCHGIQSGATASCKTSGSSCGIIESDIVASEDARTSMSCKTTAMTCGILSGAAESPKTMDSFHGSICSNGDSVAEYDARSLSETRGNIAASGDAGSTAETVESQFEVGKSRFDHSGSSKDIETSLNVSKDMTTSSCKSMALNSTKVDCLSETSGDVSMVSQFVDKSGACIDAPGHCGIVAPSCAQSLDETDKSQVAIDKSRASTVAPGTVAPSGAQETVETSESQVAVNKSRVCMYAPGSCGVEASKNAGSLDMRRTQTEIGPLLRGLRWLTKHQLEEFINKRQALAKREGETCSTEIKETSLVSGEAIPERPAFVAAIESQRVSKTTDVAPVIPDRDGSDESASDAESDATVVYGAEEASDVILVPGGDDTAEIASDSMEHAQEGAAELIVNPVGSNIGCESSPLQEGKLSALDRRGSCELLTGHAEGREFYVSPNPEPIVDKCVSGEVNFYALADSRRYEVMILEPDAENSILEVKLRDSEGLLCFKGQMFMPTSKVPTRMDELLKLIKELTDNFSLVRRRSLDDRTPVTSRSVCTTELRCLLSTDNLSSEAGVAESKSAEGADSNLQAKMAIIVKKGFDFKMSNTAWIADSGASVHMTHCRDWLRKYKPFKEKIRIELGDDRFMLAEGSGIIDTHQGILTNVYYVPEASSNLFSLGAATDNGFSIAIDANSLRVMQGKRTALRAVKQNGVYLLQLQIKPSPQSKKAVSLSEWHNRLGHVSKRKIRRMARVSAVDGLRISHQSDDRICRFCALGKCKRASHRTRTTPRVTRAGVSLHFDTVGPNPESLGGSKYTLLCKDEYSRYRMASFIATKDEIPSEVKACISRAELETGNRVLRIVSDNGTEFKNTEVNKFLKERGILHRVSTPYTAQQNGLVERDIRTIFESGRTMLIGAKFPLNLWAEAMSTAIYVINRSIDSRSDKTPYELWFGRKPDVSNLRVFGEAAIIRKQDHQRLKLEAKGEKWFFIGYTEISNTYRFYDPDSAQITVACDVTFLDEYRDDSSLVVTDEVTDVGNMSESEKSDKDAKSTEDAPLEEGKAGKVRSAKTTWNPSGSLILPTRLRKRDDTLPKYTDRRLAQLFAAKLARVEDDPASFEEAMSRHDKDKWIAAMRDEMKSLHDNKVWTLVKRPDNCNIVSNRWVLRIKRKPDGSIDRYKARLVARGFSQVYGIDYTETYAPVVSAISVRLLLAYAAVENLLIAQFDVKTAFLYGDLDETVYMEQPEGFASDESKVCLLQRSLYGLKQAPRQWNIKFTTFLKDMNLVESSNMRCIFYRSEPLLIVAIYVDDGIVLARDQKVIEVTIQQLQNRFQIHRENGTSFLGFQISRNKDGSIILHQESYVSKVISKYNMETCKSVDTPVVNLERDEKQLADNVPYRQAIGSLLYASNTCRPDITFAVNWAAKFSHMPCSSDWVNVKRILRYLQDKRDFGLHYSKEGNEKLLVYCDANYGGVDKHRHSTTGLVIFYGGAPIHWRSVTQKRVVTSSTEAEYVSLCTTIKEVMWIKRLAVELKIIEDKPVPVLCDNQSAIKIMANEGSMHRSRHIDIQDAFCREQVQVGTVDVQYVKSEDQLADMLTKPLAKSKFENNRNRMMVPGLKALVAFATVCMMLCIQTSAYIFERTRPIIWLPVENYVEIGSTQYVVDFTYIDPCGIIPSETAPNQPPVQQIVPPPQMNQPQFMQPMLQPPTNQIALDSVVYRELRAECSGLFNHVWLTKINELVDRTPYRHKKPDILPTGLSEKFRTKRGLVEDLIVGGAGGIVGITVSNLISTIFGFMNPHSDHSRIVSIEEQQMRESELISKFQQNFNTTREIEKGIVETLQSFGKSLREQNRQMMHLAQLLPKTTWLGSYVQSRIISSAADLRTIVDEYIQSRVATVEMAELLNMTNLRDLDNHDTLFESAKRIGPNTLRFAFSVREKSKDTLVYKVQAFNYWDNLTGTPTLMEYQGDKYVIYNETSNCIKAVDEPTQKAIVEDCTDKNFSDPRIKRWRPLLRSRDTRNQYNATVIKSTLTHYYIYCYPNNITIVTDELRCPPYPFKIKNEIKFKLHERVYEPRRKRLMVNAFEKPAVDMVHLSHFDPESEAVDEVKLVDKISELYQQIEQLEKEKESNIFVVKNGKLWYASIGLTILMGFCLIGLMLYGLKISKKGQRTNRLIYGDMQEMKNYSTITACTGCSSKGPDSTNTQQQNMLSINKEKPDTKGVEVGRDNSVTVNINRPLPSLNRLLDLERGSAGGFA